METYKPETNEGDDSVLFTATVPAMEVGVPVATEIEDRLSSCAALPQILPLLNMKDVHSMLRVNNLCNKVINRNWNLMQRWPTNFRIKFDVEGVTIKYMVDGAKPQKLKIEGSHITSTNAAFPAFLKQFFNNCNTGAADVYFFKAMTRYNEPTQRLEFERTMEVLLRRTVVIGLHVDASALEDDPRGGECWSMVEGCLRRFSRTAVHGLRELHFQSPQFLPVQKEIVNELGNRWCTMHCDVSSAALLTSLHPQPASVVIKGLIWNPADVQRFFEEWENDTRKVGRVVIDGCGISSLEYLWEMLLNDILRSKLLVRNIDHLEKCIHLTRTIDKRILVVGCDDIPESNKLRISFVEVDYLKY